MKIINRKGIANESVHVYLDSFGDVTNSPQEAVIAIYDKDGVCGAGSWEDHEKYLIQNFKSEINTTC